MSKLGTERELEMIKAWFSPGDMLSILKRFNVAQDTINQVWRRARLAGTLPMNVKRLSPEWHKLTCPDKAQIKLVPKKECFFEGASFKTDSYNGAPTVGHDALLQRLKAAHT